MIVTYARKPLTKSIFLAGPTPRHIDVKSWRPEALDILQDVYKFDGTVFVPEDGDGSRSFEYDDQVTWEWEAINQATVVVFWIPRDITTMPAFVTNVEFGLMVQSGKVVFGSPPEAYKMGYLKTLAARYNVPEFSTLTDTLKEAVRRTTVPFGLYSK